jgi:hypothetical protein
LHLANISSEGLSPPMSRTRSPVYYGPDFPAVLVSDPKIQTKRQRRVDMKSLRPS